MLAGGADELQLTVGTRLTLVALALLRGRFDEADELITSLSEDVRVQDNVRVEVQSKLLRALALRMCLRVSEAHTLFEA